METTDNPAIRRTAIAGIIVCLVPLVYTILWIYIFNQYDTQPERMASYKQFLPHLLQDPSTAKWVFIAMSAASVLLSVFGMRQPNKVLWVFSLVTIIVGSMLTLLLIWSML